MSHPRFGPAISAWQEHGVISRNSKGMAICGMGLAFGVSVWAQLPVSVLILQAIVLMCVAGFILSRPSFPTPPGDSNPSEP